MSRSGNNIILLARPTKRRGKQSSALAGPDTVIALGDRHTREPGQFRTEGLNWIQHPMAPAAKEHETSHESHDGQSVFCVVPHLQIPAAFNQQSGDASWQASQSIPRGLAIIGGLGGGRGSGGLLAMFTGVAFLSSDRHIIVCQGPRVCLAPELGLNFLS